MTQLASDVMDLFLDRVTTELTPLVGTTYAINIREPLDTEIQPFQIWIAVSSIGVDERFADQMKKIQITNTVYVTTVYEFSREAVHYRQVRRMRKEILKALQRSVILPVEDALFTVGAEETFLEESYFMSSFPITASWSEGV